MTAQPHRLDAGGRIDRDTEITFSVDGETAVGYPGDTLASALLASGRVEVGRSIYRARPRGIMAAGVEEPNAMVKVRRPGVAGSESMLPATVVELVDGLQAWFQSGVGELEAVENDAPYDKLYAHADVCIVGGGPAGIAAALEASSGGARVILLDDQPELGGTLLSDPEAKIDGSAALSWVADSLVQLQDREEVQVLSRTSVVGAYDANYLVAVQNRTDHLGERAADLHLTGVSRQRLWHIRAAQVVVATGAHERPLVFANNDRPGVMLASAVRTYLNRYGVAAGSRVVVATTNDSPYALVHELVAAGVNVVTVTDARNELSATAAAARESGVKVMSGATVIDSLGNPVVSAAVVSQIDEHGTPVGERLQVECDLVAVSGGWSPVVHLHSQRQGRLRWDEELVGFVPLADVSDEQVVGAARGVYSLSGCLADGARAGRAAREALVTGELNIAEPDNSAVNEGAATASSTRALWAVRADDGSLDGLSTHFLDFQRDQSVSEVLRATGAGMRSVEHVKRYTSISTASDQGKTSGVNTIGVIADAVRGGAAVGEVGTTTYRAPYVPVTFAALPGREHGDLFDPARRTPIHAWHTARGAEFEAVGQWLRAAYYPQPGESVDDAVLRECTSVRTSVGMMDASTLGKIEIWGADAGEFLNRMYTNAFKKLKPGSIRYGVMCTPDGMIFDDGVTLRVEEGRYYVTTTTGGAAHVFEWLEEWHQTEWPDLDVSLTSVTEQWATVAVAGPKSRAVIAKLAPDLDVSNEAFPFMTFHETVLASGIPARVCRVSFSGELAFEVNVGAWYGLQVWESIYAAGAEFDITPYGTEATYALRAEKGYPLVGQDTDGTTTPQDAGMEWIVSKAKPFIGKRSYTRLDTSRADRKHLVSVLPADPTMRLPEGTAVLGHTSAINPGISAVPMLGHVTSSYHSVALNRSFGLALIKNGRNLIGHTLTAAVDDTLVDVVVGDTVLYDPQGERRDG